MSHWKALGVQRGRRMSDVFSFHRVTAAPCDGPTIGLFRYYLLEGLMVLAVLRGGCYTAPADRPINGVVSQLPVFFHNTSSVCPPWSEQLAVLLDRLPLNSFAAQAQELTPRTTTQAEIRKLQMAM